MAQKQFNKQSNDVVSSLEKSLIPSKSILHCEGFDYLYLGRHHEFAKKQNIQPGEMIESGYNVLPYDPTDEDYFLVQAVFKYQDKYYFLPDTESFSLQGSLSPKRPWKLVEKKLEYRIEELAYEICVKECPGYLDEWPHSSDNDNEQKNHEQKNQKPHPPNKSVIKWEDGFYFYHGNCHQIAKENIQKPDSKTDNLMVVQRLVKSENKYYLCRSDFNDYGGIVIISLDSDWKLIEEKLDYEIGFK
jgi:hypothetical protein